MRKSTALTVTFLLAASLPFAAAAVFNVSTIKIEKSFIKAAVNGQSIELKLVDHGLTVAALPKQGFYGLQLGDRVAAVDGTAVHTTDAFIAGLQKSDDNGKTAELEVIRASKTLTLPLPKKGYTWFL